MTNQASLEMDDFDTAVACHQAGQLQEAKALYHEILTSEPDALDVKYLLAAIAYQEEAFDLAKSYLEPVLAGEPDNPGALYLAGLVAYRQANFEVAAQQIALALTLEGAVADADAYLTLGNAQRFLNRLNDALTSYRKALEINPSHPEANFQLGLCLSMTGHFAAAEQALDCCLTLDPTHVEAHFQLANLFANNGQLTQAENHYRQAIDLSPRHASAINNLGNILRGLGQPENALACFQQASNLLPEDMEIRINLANLQDSLNGHATAIATLKQSLYTNPGHADTYLALGQLLQDQYQLDEAAAHFRAALGIDPHNIDAHLGLSATLVNLALFDEARAHCLRALALDPSKSSAYSNYLLAMHYQTDISQQDLFEAHIAYAKHFETPVLTTARHAVDRKDKRPLKIGLVSGDFRFHVVGTFLLNVLKHLDRQNLVISLFSTSSQTDSLTEQLRKEVSHWECLAGVPDDLAAELINRAQIDILVDLSGHTAHNRLPLFARKLAPVQVSWLGYWATSGLQTMDYILCLEQDIPENETKYFTERPWYLPDTRLCFNPPGYAFEVSPLPALTEGSVTLGCFNNLIKMNDQVVALWARILRAIPQSRLFLKASQLKTPSQIQFTLARFAAHGIDAERLILEGPGSHQEYLTAYNRVDIALDPFPFTGGTTSCEGLWMGVPYITLKGDRLIARQGEGILRLVGLTDWIAANADDYVAKAVSLSMDIAKLAKLRTTLRPNLLSSPLCDAAQFARNLESAFAGMWQAYCHGSHHH